MAHHVMENIPPKPRILFEPASPFVKKLLEGGALIEKHYYLHPKLGNAYRYKYKFEDTVWWIDVNLDGDSAQMWKLDGSCWYEGKAAGGTDADEDDE
jgi:hypothetical protein